MMAYDWVFQYGWDEIQARLKGLDEWSKNSDPVIAEAAHLWAGELRKQISAGNLKEAQGILWEWEDSYDMWWLDSEECSDAPDPDA